MSVIQFRAPACAQSFLDDGFYASLSQTLLQLFSLCCIIIPLLRSRNIPKLRVWFYISLVTSAATAIASVAVYSFQWQATGLLNFAAGVTGVIATMQIVEGADAVVKDAELGTKARRGGQRHGPVDVGTKSR